MKLYTVIEIPDEDYEMSDHWVIDVDGDIRYESEDGDALMHYKSPQYDYELRPLPKKRDTRIFYFEDEDTDYRAVGFNDCLALITGETE